jgi:hypothetical protein
MSLQVLNGPIITAGESLSSAIDCSGGEVVRITMPPAWTEAMLTFQISTDGTFFNDVFDPDGFEKKVFVVPGAAVIMPSDYSRAITFIKFRSGTRTAPVEQEFDRAFAIAIEVKGNKPAPSVEVPMQHQKNQQELNFKG